MRAFGTLGIAGLIGVVLGAVNWGLVGLFDYDLVEEIFGAGTAADVIYVVIGVTGILALGAVIWAFGVITRGGAGSVLAVLGAVATVVAVIGAINWGLVGLFDYDLVEAIFGTGTAADTVYVIIGAAGLLTIPTLLGAWGFRSGERRIESSSDGVELRRALDESRRRDEDVLRALDESRQRDEEMSRRLDELQETAIGLERAARGAEGVYAAERVSEPYDAEPLPEDSSEPYRTRDDETVARDETDYAEAPEETSAASAGAESYSADAEERYEESFVVDERGETGPEHLPTDEEAGRRREAA